MQYEQPQYSDGIVKGKQSRFGGLNHNEGAGDGALFQMRNLCSDYYPLIATREKRRRLRTLTNPNGLYAWEKLCWVDGTTFYYDGVAKGTVEDSRKQFAAINDIIIIMPDKKYYDVAEDKFGDLEAEVRGRDAGEQTAIDTTPAETVTVRPGKVARRTWNNWARGGAASTYGDIQERLVYYSGGIVVRDDEIVTNPLSSVSNLSSYIGQYVYICNINSKKNSGPKKLTGINTVYGETRLQFESGSLEDGEFRKRYADSNEYPDKMNNGDDMDFIEIRKCYLTPVHFANTGKIDDSGIKGRIWLEENSLLTNWKYLFGGGLILDIQAGEHTYENVETEGVGQGAEERTSYLTAVGTPFDPSTVISDEVTITISTVPDVIFRDGTLGGEPAAANTIYQEGTDWAEYAAPGDSIRIIDSEFQGGAVNNDGIYLIREVDGHELRFDANSFTNCSYNKARDSFVGREAIRFEITHPGVAFFSENKIHCRLGEEEWTEYLEDGALVKIEGCDEEENNQTLLVRKVEEQDLSFDEGSFTEVVDSNGFTITRLYQHPIEFRDGSIYGEPAAANTIYCNNVVWSDYFHVGDTITITGSTIEENNQTLIVREVDGHEMRFYENTFTNGLDTGTAIMIRRNMPALECVFENDNRLWGYSGKTIYASKLGDPFNFEVFDGLDTDSYAVDTGSPGNFTGGWSYMGYPTFFKEENVYKVYGSKPSNYEVMAAAKLGLVEGGGKSLAVAGETLFYLGSCGVIMYNGGIPTPINRAFGQERYRNAVAGSDGLKYYVSMEDSEGEWHLFVYDVWRGMWHEEDNTEVINFAYLDGNLYYLDSEGNVMVTGNLKFHPEDSEEEENFDWWAEFTDFVDDSPNKKGINKFQIRMELDEDEADPPSVTVKLMCDSDGTWIIPEGGTIENPEKRSYILPIIPRRADHYKLRIEGHGGCRIYSIAKEYYQGSDFKSQPGRH